MPRSGEDCNLSHCDAIMSMEHLVQAKGRNERNSGHRTHFVLVLRAYLSSSIIGMDSRCFGIYCQNTLLVHQWRYGFSSIRRLDITSRVIELPTDGVGTTSTSAVVHPGLDYTFTAEWADAQFEGDMTDAVLYNSSLSSADIMDIYNQGLPGPPSIPAVRFSSAQGSLTGLFTQDGSYSFNVSGTEIVKNVTGTALLTMNSNWTVSFEKGKGAPQHVFLPVLESLKNK